MISKAFTTNALAGAGIITAITSCYVLSFLAIHELNTTPLEIQPYYKPIG